MSDLFVTELDGYGDLQMQGNDLMIAQGFESVPFLALFGDDGDWWGNEMLEGSQLFVSKTEATLKSFSLNSGGLIRIEQAIKDDLKFITESVPGTKVEVNVTLHSDDRLDIMIGINGQTWYYNWNPKEPGLPKERKIFKGRVHTKEFVTQFI